MVPSSLAGRSRKGIALDIACMVGPRETDAVTEEKGGLRVSEYPEEAFSRDQPLFQPRNKA